jgi:precorrin-6Y C5,15-methyltransferase (decarboxylating)
LPEALANLPQPDAVFIGGGLSADLVTRVYEVLQPGGVMVAHCVTIESEALLTSMWQKFGGNLARLSVHHADPVGGFHGWRPLMPVTQWHLVKPIGDAT